MYVSMNVKINIYSIFIYTYMLMFINIRLWMNVPIHL